MNWTYLYDKLWFGCDIYVIILLWWLICWFYWTKCFAICFRMNKRYVIASTVIGFLAICALLPFCATLTFCLILFVISVILGIISALWINIMLSSPHKIVLGSEHILKQSEIFRNKLMVTEQAFILLSIIWPEFIF